jgi:hypothetical protein
VPAANHVGRYAFSNGEVYDGEWKRQQRDGYAKITASTGHVFEGVVKGERMVSGTIVQPGPNGEIQKGSGNLGNFEKHAVFGLAALKRIQK